MAAAAAPVPRRDPVLWGVVAVATVLRVWLAWHFFGFLGGDDVEILEEAFRAATGLVYAPWNVRNLLLPDAIVAPLLRLAAALGVSDVGTLAFVATLPFIAFASLNVVLVYRIAGAWLTDRGAARAAAVLYAFHWLPLAYGSTVYARTASTTCVLLATLAVSGRGSDRRRGVLAGVALAGAFAARYSEGMYLLPLVVACYAAARDRAAARARAAAMIGAFALAAVAAIGASDALAWGTPFASLSHLWGMMIRGAGAEGLSTRPPYFYLVRVLFWVTPAAFPALAVAWRDRRVRWAWAFVGVPLVLLSLVAHKELRYLQGAIPYLAVLGSAGLAILARRWGRAWAAALLILTVGFQAYGVRTLEGKSMAAVSAARRLAAERSVRVVALSQSWAYGDRLYLGNGVEVRDLPTPPVVASLGAVVTGADVAGLYLKDLAADPAIGVVMAVHGFAERERIAWGESKTVVLFARTGGDRGASAPPR